MNATPRVRSGGFPQTPGAVAPRARRDSTPSSQPRPQRPRPSLPPAPENRSAAAVAERPPLIPLTVIDAPTQRFYAVAVYVALLAYRFWDWIYVVEEDAGSFMLFGKWVALDFAFLFVALPALRIPWLDLSQPVAISLFFAQSVLNWVLMFNIQVYWTTWLLGVVKIFYDRELSISEHNVKVSSILHNSSLIMGKQIINILPEGSALLNPEKTPFCVGPGGKTVVALPLYFNATIPAEVELLRIDLETNSEEVVKLSKSQIREIDRQAKKITEDGGITSYRYDVPVKKVGVYRLHKVLDEYKLEVQRITEPTYVVPCPKAQVRRAESSTRCLNDLSNLSLEVHGTPPLKIVYSRSINGKDHSFHFQSLQPDGFSSPLLGAAKTSAMVLTEGEDVSWARAQHVAVALNESMGHAGDWQYAIDEVHDVFGNVVKYAVSGDDGELKPKPKHLVQNFVVRERPQATLRDCDLRNPLKVARGLSTQLPVRFSLPGQTANRVSYTLTWQFSPIDTLTKSGDHGDVVEIGTFTARNARDQPTISAPGLYTLKSISCDGCDGEIEEPSSCLLLNPLEPKLAITAEGIPDKCASTSIGLRVDLDLVGTPPFKVVYDVTSDTERHRTESVVVKGLRQQIDLLPRSAGHYQYRFRSIQDAVYHSVNLPLTDEYTLEQNVKPPATAYFENQSGISACLDQQVEVDVTLLGDGPFTLEWELVHDGTRDTKMIKNIDSNSYKIQTAPLTKGGEYTIALKSIRDKTGCSIFLKEEKHISVRRQRPRAGFGQIEKKRSATVVEEARVGLPLRLHGEGPWEVSYRNLDSGRGVQVKRATSPNDFIETTERGIFEIVDVMDNQCHGQVDPSASKFEVSWFPRPEISVVPADTISENRGVFVKQEVCEGDVDGFEVALKGTAPYHVAYEIRHKPKSGSGSVARKEFDAAMPKASIPLDTGKAGLYTYKFSALADNLYNNDKRKFQPLTLEQRVNAKPAASFVKPGQIFKMCMSEQEYEEKIPITLQGVAPFYVEIEIRHNSGSIPETFRIPNIPSSSYTIQIPRQYLKLGAQTIRIRNVRDARGCQQKIEGGGPSVQVQLYDAPSIYPLETRADYCVGERIAYTLSGLPPFEVQYTFAGSQMKAKSQSTNFRRIAEAPGDFTITSVSDKASECRAALELTKTIHPMPSVRISRGKVVRVDIHEGSEVEILFEFWGTPPFEFTYTRSSNANPRNGQRSVILETRHDVSYEHTKIVTASLEGTYEVVAIKDKYCAFSTMAGASGADAGGKKDKVQKMLAY